MIKLFKKIILAIVFLVLILPNNTSAEVEIPELTEGVFLYDLNDSVNDKNMKHINKLSGELHKQNGVGFYVITVDTDGYTDELMSNIIDKWKLDDGKNMLLLFENTKDVQYHFYKSDEIDWLMTNDFASAAIKYGLVEFNRNSFNNGVEFSYNSIFRMLGTYYNVNIEGVDVENLPRESHLKDWLMILGFTAIVFTVIVLSGNKKRRLG